MAIEIEFVNVIVRKSAIERCFPGGLDAFVRQDIPNYLEDEHILRVGFMSTREAEELAEKLVSTGVKFDSTRDSEIAIVLTDSVPVWLECGNVDGRYACWLAGTRAGDCKRISLGIALRCPRAIYDSIADVATACGAVVEEVSAVEKIYPEKQFRFMRNGAEFKLDIFGDADAAAPFVGLWSVPDFTRRATYHLDVALTRDVERVLTERGASVPRIK